MVLSPLTNVFADKPFFLNTDLLHPSLGTTDVFPLPTEELNSAYHI